MYSIKYGCVEQKRAKGIVKSVVIKKQSAWMHMFWKWSSSCSTSDTLTT
jgi:hypothetical protein